MPEAEVAMEKWIISDQCMLAFYFDALVRLS